MRLYICGPMTGYPDFNYPEFFRVQQALLNHRYATLSPTVNSHDMEDGSPLNVGIPREEAVNSDEYYAILMRRSIKQLVQCDGVALLDGWEDSSGCDIEVQIARWCKMPVEHYQWWLAKPKPIVISSIGVLASGHPI